MLDSCECKHPPLVKDVIQVIWLLFQQHRNKDNHIHLSEYLTKGRLILVDGTLSSSLWKDKNGESQIQLSITAESIAFINTGKREGAAAGADNDVNGADSAPVPPADFPQDEKEDLPF